MAYDKSEICLYFKRLLYYVYKKLRIELHYHLKGLFLDLYM